MEFRFWLTTISYVRIFERSFRSSRLFFPPFSPTSPVSRPLQIWHGDLPNAKDVEKEEEEEKERVIKLDDDQVTREELIEIVRSCVRDSIANARNGGKFSGLPWLLTDRKEGEDGGKPGAKGASSSAGGDKKSAARSRRGASVATEEEIIRAADMLLDQCGEDREDVETEDFSSLTHALERMLQGQQRLVDGQRLVIEGQQRVQSAEKRIEEMHHTVKELLGGAAQAGTPLSPGAEGDRSVASFFANVANRVAGRPPRGGSSLNLDGGSEAAAPLAAAEQAAPEARPSATGGKTVE